jgi:hypothetical protein
VSAAITHPAPTAYHYTSKDNAAEHQIPLRIAPAPGSMPAVTAFSMAGRRNLTG